MEKKAESLKEKDICLLRCMSFDFRLPAPKLPGRLLDLDLSLYGLRQES